MDPFANSSGAPPFRVIRNELVRFLIRSLVLFETTSTFFNTLTEFLRLFTLFCSLDETPARGTVKEGEMGNNSPPALSSPAAPPPPASLLGHSEGRLRDCDVALMIARNGLLCRA